jgi:hypothetical protein
MQEPLINEADITAAQERITRAGTVASIIRLFDEQPDLYFAVSELAVTALAGRRGVTRELRRAAHQNVWFAALTALESYRLACDRVPRGVELGHALRGLDQSMGDPPQPPDESRPDSPRDARPE